MDQPTGLLLHDDSSRPHMSAAHQLANLDLHDVASAQLAVDGEVEESSFAHPLFPIEEEANGADLLRLERSLGADQLTCIPSFIIAGARIVLRSSHDDLVHNRHRPEEELTTTEERS